MCVCVCTFGIECFINTTHAGYLHLAGGGISSVALCHFSSLFCVSTFTCTCIKSISASVSFSGVGVGLDIHVIISDSMGSGIYVSVN